MFGLMAERALGIWARKLRDPKFSWVYDGYV